MIPSLSLRVLTLSPAKAVLILFLSLTSTELLGHFRSFARRPKSACHETSAASSLFIMATSEEIFREAMALSPEVRAELAERSIGSLAEDVRRRSPLLSLPK
jgi:hypothetical protein